MASVQHLPASIQVELLLVLLEILRVLHRLLGEDGLSLIDLAFAKQFIDLLLRVFFAQDKHL